MSARAGICLFRRANGFYYVVYTRQGRRRWRSTHCRSRAQALQVIAGSARLLEPKPVRKPLSIFIREFLEYAQATFSPATVDLYKNALQHLVRSASDVSLTALTAQHLDRYKIERLKTMSPTSVNMELRSIKAAMSTAVRWKVIQTNPFSEVKLIRVPETTPLFLSKQEFSILLSAIGDRWFKELVVFAVSTGMRQGEMRNLRWKDVDLARKVIHVQSSVGFRTKAGKQRTIPINDVVCAMLAGKPYTSAEDLVFTRHGFRIWKDTLVHKFKKSILAAGLDKRIHWHTLRHTHASWLVQDGVSLYVVQKLLGHSTARVTEVYAHLQPEQMHETVNKIAVTIA